MNALKKLEQMFGDKPYIGFTMLNPGYHSILEFQAVKTKFTPKGEKSIRIELDNQILFLPQYFRKTLDDDDLAELNRSIKDGNKVYLMFGGRKEENG